MAVECRSRKAKELEQLHIRYADDLGAEEPPSSLLQSEIMAHLSRLAGEE